MADFETQIKESQAQVAAAQAKISAITATIEKARVKLDEGVDIDVENATLEDVHKHTEVMNANIAELIMGLDDVTAGFSKDFDEMRSKTGWRASSAFSRAGSPKACGRNGCAMPASTTLQDLIAKSDVIVKLLQGQLTCGTARSKVEANLTPTDREATWRRWRRCGDIAAMDPR